MARIVKKPEERRREIVDAARTLFQTRQYEHTTMQDVINSVGIAKGTIYHYFKSKKELLEAVIEEIISETIDEMRKIIDTTSGNALQKIEKLMMAGNIAAEQKTFLDQLHKPGNEAMHVKLLAAALTRQAPLYAELIRQGCDEGLFQTDHPLECAEFILSGVQFLTDIGIADWSEDQLSRRASAFPDLIEKLLQTPSGSFQFINQIKRNGI